MSDKLPMYNFRGVATYWIDKDGKKRMRDFPKGKFHTFKLNKDGDWVEDNE